MIDLKIISWNVNGLRAIIKKGFFDFIKKDDPDILCLQETKIQEKDLTDQIRHINKYYSYFSTAEKKGYSGTAIYTKVKPIEVKYGIGIKKFDSEGRFVILKFKEFTLFNVYFPNGKMSAERLNYKLDFYEAFLKYINKRRKAGENIIFCGDVNTAHTEIDLARPKANQEISGFLPIERKWIDKVIKNHYLDSWRIFNQSADNYTYWDYKTKARDRNVGWRIDYFFISHNLKKRLKNAYILNKVMGSDHCPIGIDLAVTDKFSK